MKISNNLSINKYNQINSLNENEPVKNASSPVKVQHSAENIKGSYNVAFFGLFGKNKKNKEPLPVDARFVNFDVPLVQDMKYAVSEDAQFFIGNNFIDLANPSIRPYIYSLKLGDNFVLGRNTLNPTGWRINDENDKHIQISRNNNGQLLAANISKTHPVTLLRNVITPQNLSSPFRLEPGKNYFLPNNSIIQMAGTIVPLRSLENVTAPLQEGQSLILGRGAGANILYDDDNVSRNHLQLTKRGNGFLVKDLHSLNGSAFLDVEKHYQSDLSQINSIVKLQRGIPTKVPNDSQLYLGYDMTLDMRNTNILDELDKKGRITIGRSQDSDFVVSQFYNQVSNEHLILEKDGNDIIATDVSRTNGTVVIPKNQIQPFYGDLNNLSLNQGNIGDCYLLSAIYALSRNPRGQQILRNMVSVADDGSYIVRFYNKAPIAVKANELDGQIKSNGKQKRSVSGDLGIKAIERAYAKMLKNEREKKLLPDFNPEMTMFYKIDKGGYVDVAVKKLSGINMNAYSTRKSSVNNILNYISSTGVNNHITACTTPNKANYDGYVDPQQRFISGHAYAIKDVDALRRTISIVNPHNTKNTYMINWDEFSRYFDYLYDAMA